MKWFYLFLAIIGEVIATISLRMTEGFTKWIPSVLVILGYGFSFYSLSFVLKSIPVGIAYAIWSGVGIVLISILGLFFFDQKLDAPAILGIALILVGVLIINLFSKTTGH